MATQLNISDLIYDVLIKIFDQVALQDLLFSVPMVCRSWNAVVPQVCRRKKKLYLYLYPDTDIEYFQVDRMHFLEMAPSWVSSSNLLVLDQENNKLALLDKFDRIEELSIYNYHGQHIGSMLLKWSSTLVTLKIYFDVRLDYCKRFFKKLYVNGQFLLPKLKSLSIGVNESNLVYVPLALITGQLEVFNLYTGAWTYGQDNEHLIAIIKHIDQVAPASLTLKHFGYYERELSSFHVNLKRANLLEARIPLKRLSLVSGPILYKEELADICRHYPSISYLSLKIYGPFRMKEVLTAIKPLRHCLRRLKIIFSLRHGCGGIEEVWSKHRKSLSAFKVLFELVQSVRLVTKEGYISSIRDFSKECSNVGATADHPLFSEISRIFPKAMFYTGF